MSFVLVLIATAIVVYVFAAFRAKPALVLSLTIQPSGDYVAVIDPKDADSKALIRFLLCYGSKVRWLLKNEPDELTEVLDQIVSESVDAFSAMSTTDLTRETSVGRSFEEIKGHAPAAVAGGERFVVRYFVHQGNRGGITNDIPRPGLAINLAWHYLLVLQAVRSRLNQHDRSVAQRALQGWRSVAFGAGETWGGLGGLNKLNAVANDCVDKAISLTS